MPFHILVISNSLLLSEYDHQGLFIDFVLNVVERNLCIDSFLSLPLSIGIISTKLKISESSTVLKALLFIHGTRIDLVPYRYLLIMNQETIHEKM